MNKQRGLGFGLILVGIVLISSSTFGMTGAVIGAGVVEYVSSLIGLAFIMAGCVVLMGRRGRESKLVEITERSKKGMEELRQIFNNKTMKSYDKIKSLAERSGYVIKEGKKHYKVYYADGVTPLTTGGRTGLKQVTIPYHDFKKGTYLGILNDLIGNDPFRYSNVA